ncbi:hypothetical protein [Laspinema olomoucense]|uniref:hypothetical protein n=1 Tax=Laspinema olomoucense TaxID=3231600 RepID=UPI0021BB9F66|nr:hypothetical protein [Laspinema sp. D3d]MCT7971116.1 hypothetical protein [Laspinema sp. D3d]
MMMKLVIQKVWKTARPIAETLMVVEEQFSFEGTPIAVPCCPNCPGYRSNGESLSGRSLYQYHPRPLLSRLFRLFMDIEQQRIPSSGDRSINAI